MARVKVSSKYQIVIPRKVREALGIQKGQMVSVGLLRHGSAEARCRSSGEKTSAHSNL